MARDQVTVEVGDLCLKAVEGEGGDDPEGLSRAFSRAVHYYLADRDAGGIGWRYPRFLGDGEPRSRRAVTIEVDAEAWRELVAEAARQDVAPDRLVEHAVLYLAADLDSGRLTERILEDLD